MSSTSTSSLAVELERLKGKQEGHEDLCAERYDRIDKGMTAIQQSVTDLGSQVGAIANAQLIAKGAAERPKWWLPIATAAVTTLIAGLLGLIGWLGGQVYSEQNAKIDAALKRATPTQTATVNPTTPQPTAPPLPSLSLSPS